MNSKNRKKLALTLITNDLINHKLVMGLEHLGIDPCDYHLYLNTSIFKLIGIPKQNQNDELYRRYTELCHKILPLDLKGERLDLETLALEIFEELERCCRVNTLGQSNITTQNRLH